VSGVLQDRLDKEAAKKAEIASAVKASASRRIAEATPAVLTLAEEKALANAAVDAIDAGAEPEEPEDETPAIAKVAVPLTEVEMALLLSLLNLAGAEQAEVARRAACARKKVAPKFGKVKKVKELTPAQKEKLAKAEKAAETYTIAASAAIGFVGKGLGESKKMVVALGLLNLPALRWLAKQYEGVAIPKDKRSAADIREFLRVELLNWRRPYQIGDLAAMNLEG
jgi:hypothetical protein